MIRRRRFIAGMLGAAGASVLDAGLWPMAWADAAATNELVQRLADDPRRPQFHLLPAANWMNDPNGPIYFNGKYHMFYQYNPHGAVWGDMHWGHAVSADMIHWRHMPVALAPTPGGPDSEGCFSGTAIVQDGRVAFVYTGVRTVPKEQATLDDGVNAFRESQCLAIANDASLSSFTKVSQPVIAAPPAGMKVTGFRDPSPWKQAPWRQGDDYYMVVGSGVKGQGGAVLLYRSKDLREWEFLRVVAGGQASGTDASNPVDSGDMWECPDLFALGGKHVLIYSTVGKARWQSGELDAKEMIFHPEKSGTLDMGSFYAPKTQLDRAGRRILWGWIPETRPVEEYKAAGWAGMMSLPRVLTLANDGQLRVDVAAEFSRLRRNKQALTLTQNETENQRQICGLRLRQCCAELLISVRKSNGAFEVSLGEFAADGRGWLSLKIDPLNSGQISIDSFPIDVSLANAETVEIHLYVDGSAIEAFVNGQAAYTKRFYYSSSQAPDAGLKWTGNTAGIASISAWQLTPISSDRLTT
jgi:beta-fructofuranosidase